jgi:hypothetical protein
MYRNPWAVVILAFKKRSRVRVLHRETCLFCMIHHFLKTLLEGPTHLAEILTRAGTVPIYNLSPEVVWDTAYTLLSGDLIFQMLRCQGLMGSARPGTSFCGHYIISTHVFNCLKPFEVHSRVVGIFAFLIPISGSRAHRKDTKCA